MDKKLEDTLHREGLTLADTKKRAIAFMIDEMLLSFILIFALWDSFSSAQTMEEIILVSNHFALEYMTMKIFYQAFFIMKYGASIGKLTMKIRVIEIKTLGKPNVLSSLNRAIFRIISETFLYLGFLWGVLDPFKQAWHDKTAKTLVINA